MVAASDKIDGREHRPNPPAASNVSGFRGRFCKNGTLFRVAILRFPVNIVKPSQQVFGVCPKPGPFHIIQTPACGLTAGVEDLDKGGQECIQECQAGYVVICLCGS